MPVAELLAPVAFICSDWVIYWSGFATNSALFITIIICFVLYALYYHLIAKNPTKEFGWRYIAWLLPWFGGMWVLRPQRSWRRLCSARILARRHRRRDLEPDRHRACEYGARCRPKRRRR
jgi:hypothetical protein